MGCEYTLLHISLHPSLIVSISIGPSEYHRTDVHNIQLRVLYPRDCHGWTFQVLFYSVICLLINANCYV